MEKLISLLKDKDKMKHYLLYLVFGILTTIVDFTVLYLLSILVPILNENISNSIAVFASIIFAYFTNRKYVFKSKEINKFKEFTNFLISRMFSSLFNIVMFWIMTTFTPINKFLVKAIISVVVIILNYIFSKLFVFKQNKSL